MTTKPDLSEADVLQVLDGIFSAPISSFAEAQDGQIAKTFSFVVHGRDHFIQFNHATRAQADKTETHFQDKFRRQGVPVRRVVAQGTAKALPGVIPQAQRATVGSTTPATASSIPGRGMYDDVLTILEKITHDRRH